MTHESNFDYLSLCFGIIYRASDYCSGHERALNLLAITRGFPKNYFSESTALANISPSSFLLKLPIIAACIHCINSLKQAINDNDNENTTWTMSLLCFSSNIYHAIGCRNEYWAWIYKNGMQISTGNAELLNELSQLVETKNKQTAQIEG